jgi:hypothetical protein
MEPAALDIENHSCTASDSKVIIKVPFLIATPVGTVCDDGAAVGGPGDVQDKAETGKTC